MTTIYRTLVRGNLVQRSSLCVGGSPNESGGADLQCARDGLGRLTIPGTGLAGCLVETAGRIFRELFEADDRGAVWGRITSKRRDGVADQVWQSLWRFSPAHRKSDRTELRQGVGIRHATGAAAGQGRALFDAETVPPGENWEFLFEVDTLRGGDRVEGAALLALGEWARGRCWLGASAARGMGWMDLRDLEVMRIPCTPAAVDRWPNNGERSEDWWDQLARDTGAEWISGAAVQGLALRLWGRPLPARRFWYITLDGVLRPGAAASGYGWDGLSVGGHVAGFLAPLSTGLLGPLGGREEYTPDAPVVTSGADDKAQRPFVPGSGLRGPLRHAASRWHRQTAPVIDPNENDPTRGDRRVEKGKDAVSQLFGLTGHSARVLVCDGRLAAGAEWKLAWLQHHAEDEFAGGVFGTGKFDRTAVLEGSFDVRLVLEAEAPKEMEDHLTALAPALRLAELGYVGVGGGKQRGLGRPAWVFTRASVGRAGEEAQAIPATAGVRVLDLLEAVRGLMRGGDA